MTKQNGTRAMMANFEAQPPGSEERSQPGPKTAKNNYQRDDQDMFSLWETLGRPCAARAPAKMRTMHQWRRR